MIEQLMQIVGFILVVNMVICIIWFLILMATEGNGR